MWVNNSAVQRRVAHRWSLGLLRQALAPCLALSLVLVVHLAQAAQVRRVAIMEFEGRGSGGAEMSDAIELELELADDIVLVPRKRIQKALRGPASRASVADLSRALRRAEADAVLLGEGRRGTDGPEIEVTAYARSGRILLSEVYTLSSRRPDVDTLAPMIAESLQDALAQEAAAPPEVRDDDGYEDELPEDDLELPEDEPQGRRPLAAAGDPLDDEDADLFVEDDDIPAAPDERGSGSAARRPLAGSRSPGQDADRASARGGSWSERYRDEDRPSRDSSRSGRRRRLLDDDDEEDWDSRVIRSAQDEPRDSISDIDSGRSAVSSLKKGRHGIPFVAIAAGFDPLYWNYSVESPVGSSRVDWTPLQPLAGGSLRLEAWPLIYVGGDAQARAGKVQVDLSGIRGLQQKAIEIFFYEAQVHLRAQYVLEEGLPGLAFGARLGYRFLMADSAQQTPYTVIPSTTAHMLAPGLDLRIPFHPQYAVLKASAEVIPFAAYSEAPDEPGAPGSAAAFGFRVDALFRSVFAYGIFAELRFFYEELYLDYSGVGTRQDLAENVFHDGKVVTGLRGLSLAVGWSY